MELLIVLLALSALALGAGAVRAVRTDGFRAIPTDRTRLP